MTERQSFFSSDLGISGVYDDADGMFNPIQENSVNKDLETIPKETSMDFTEGGAYTSRIESSYQVDKNLNGTLLSPRPDTEQVVESGRNTPDSGQYSRNIENIQTGKEKTDESITGENSYSFKSSSLPEERVSGIYSTRIGSFHESNGPGFRRSIDNRDENLRISRRPRSFDRLGATTLSTMTEEDEEILRDRDNPDLRYSRTDGFPRTSADNDNLSNSSREKNGEPPDWTNMIFNPGFNEAYLQRTWPRISLHLQSSHRPSDPFVSVPGEKLDVKQQSKYGRFLLCFLWWSFVVLAMIATVLAVFLLRTDNDGPKAYKEYVKVDMNMTVEGVYRTAYDTPTSSEYRSFTDEFCTEVGKAYRNNNNTQPSYYGCQITDLSPGSIVVIFTVYYSDTTIVIVNANARTVLVNYIESNSNKLGQLVIVVSTIAVQNATVITPVNPPKIQESPFQTTSSGNESTTTESTILGTSADLPDTKSTILVTDIITTNDVPTTKMTETTTDITDSTTADSDTITKLTKIMTETTSQMNSTEQRFTTSQSVTTEPLTLIISQSSRSLEDSTLKTSTTETKQTIADTDIPQNMTEPDMTTKLYEIPSTKTEQSTSVSKTNIIYQTTTATELTQTINKVTKTSSEPTVTVSDLRTVATDQTTKPITEMTSRKTALTAITGETISTQTEHTPKVTDSTTSSTELTSGITEATSYVTKLSTTSTVPISTEAQSTTVAEQTPFVTESTSPVTKSVTTATELTSTATELTPITTELTSTTTATELTSTVAKFTLTATRMTSSATEITSAPTQFASIATEFTSTATELTTSGTEQTTQIFKTQSTVVTEPTTNIIETTSYNSTGLVCPYSTSSQLFEDLVNISCSISNPQTYNMLYIYHREGHTDPDSVLDLKYYRNGTIYEDKRAHTDITVVITHITITITFGNVSCLFAGTFSVVLLYDATEVARSQFSLEVTERSGNPAITLHPDQIIDLVFPDGNYYRTSSVHRCEGYTGFSLSNWAIDMTYDNGATFQELPIDQLTITSRSNVSSSCVNYQTVEFAIRFSENMQKARLRCLRSDSPNISSLSDELLLVPRNICDCGDSSSERGHPYNCNSRVTCIRDSSGIYPEGVNCNPSWCRDSVSGVCSTNCSDSVCDEPVPESFCTTPAPPTTTPVPSPYVSCNDVTAQLDSGLIDIQCTLNGSSSFSSISIAFRKKEESADTPVALISNNNTITIYKNDLFVSFEDDLITITTNTTCEYEGAFWISMNINGTSVPPGFSKFSLIKDPEKPVLTLSPDQVIDLGFYRDGKGYHNCKAVVGYPIRNLIIEILYANVSEYVELTSPLLKVDLTETSPDICPSYKKITFGMTFSEEMVNATLRCRISGLNDTGAVSNEEKLFLIPRSLCDCVPSSTYRGHPDKCDRTVYCLKQGGGIYPLVQQCDSNKCRNSITGVCANDCSDDVCNEKVPLDFCTTTTPLTTTPLPATEISCDGVSVLLNSGPAEVVCQLNFTKFDLITLSRKNQTMTKKIAEINNNGTVIETEIESNREIIYQDNILTIKVLNGDCASAGTYSIKVEDSGLLYTSEVDIIIYSAAEKPTLEIPYDTIENIFKKITCNAVIGKPNWLVHILTRKEDSDKFIIPDMGVTYGKVMYSQDSCSYRKTVDFEISFTTEWNMTDVKCLVSDGSEVSNQSGSALSENGKIILIKGDYCEQETSAEYLYHPRGCFNYIRCVSGAEYSYQCPTTQCFAFNNTVPCTVCNEAPMPCNITVSL